MNGIGGDQQQRRRAQHDREQIELQQDAQARPELSTTEKTQRRLTLTAPRRDGPAARAGHLRIDVAIDDVVVGAARAAHHHGAMPNSTSRQISREAERPVVGVRPAPARTRRARTAASADRPVQPHQPEIGLDRPGTSIDPACGRHRPGGRRSAGYDFGACGSALMVLERSHA